MDKTIKSILNKEFVNLRITSQAHKKLDIISKNSIELTKYLKTNSVEVLMWLLNDEEQQKRGDVAVRDIYIPHQVVNASFCSTDLSRVESDHARIEGDDIKKVGEMNYKKIGWAHSHGILNVFHSSDDDNTTLSHCNLSKLILLDINLEARLIGEENKRYLELQNLDEEYTRLYEINNFILKEGFSIKSMLKVNYGYSIVTNYSGDTLSKVGVILNEKPGNSMIKEVNLEILDEENKNYQSNLEKDSIMEEMLSKIYYGGEKVGDVLKRRKRHVQINIERDFNQPPVRRSIERKIEFEDKSLEKRIGQFCGEFEDRIDIISEKIKGREKINIDFEIKEVYNFLETLYSIENYNAKYTKELVKERLEERMKKFEREFRKLKPHIKEHPYFEKFNREIGNKIKSIYDEPLSN